MTSRYLVIVAAVLISPAHADNARFGPSMRPDSSNAVLPTARENLKALPHLATNALLAAAANATYPNGVFRDHYATGGVADGPLFFTPQTGTCASQTPALVNDGGNCVDSTSGDGNSWKALHPDQRFYANEFGPAGVGCTWDSTHDVGACINAASAAATAQGGGYVNLPAGTYGLSTTLVRYPNVFIQSVSAASYGQQSTKLSWIGSVGGVMAECQTSAATTQVSGGGIIGIAFDGANSAAKGLDIWSCTHGQYAWNSFTNLTAYAIKLDEAAGASPNGQAAFNAFIDQQITLTSAAAVNASCLVFGPGDAADDANRNEWHGGYCLHQLAPGFDIGNSDGNNFYNIFEQPAAQTTTGDTHSNTTLDNVANVANLVVGQRVTGAGIPGNTFISSIVGSTVTLSQAATATATGVSVSFSGVGVNLQGSNVSVTQTARENFFYSPMTLGGVVSRGTGSYTNASFHSQLYSYKIGDGEPDPFAETGASLFWGNNAGQLNGGWSLNASGGAWGAGNFSSAALGIGATSWYNFAQGTDATASVSSNNTNANARILPKGSGIFISNVPGFGWGCTASFVNTTTFGVSICAVAEDVNGQIMAPNQTMTAAYTKTTAAWAIGTAAGCLDTGTLGTARALYLYAIQRSDTLVTDYLCTLTYGAPTMPANYDRKRYIGTVPMDGAGNLLGFTQVNNKIILAAPPLEQNATTLGTASRTTLALADAPIGFAVEANLIGSCTRAAGGTSVSLTALTTTDTAVGAGNTICNVNAGGNVVAIGDVRVMTDTNGSIAGRASQSSSTVTLDLKGWIDPQIAWQH